jgi:hypothetical protein
VEEGAGGGGRSLVSRGWEAAQPKEYLGISVHPDTDKNKSAKIPRDLSGPALTLLHKNN